MRTEWITFKGMFAESPLWKKIVIFVFSLLFGVIFFSLVGSLITKLLHWDDKSVEALKMLQFFSAFGIFVFTPLLTAFLTTKEPGKFLNLKMADPRLLFLALLSIIVIYPFINVVGVWNEGMHLPESLQSVENWMKESEESAKVLTLQFLDTHTIPGLIINLIVIALIPAIGEELMFRGVIQQTLSAKVKNDHIAIWVTAFIFSAIHVQFFGFFPRFFLGALLGYLLLYSGSIIVTMICHFMNNAFVIIYAYVSTPQKALGTDTSLPSLKAMVITGLLFLAMTIFIILTMKANQKKWNGQSLS